MPPINKLTDQNKLVPTKSYPNSKFKFEYFNPVQSRVFEIYDKDANIIISAKTSAGKTTMAEMVVLHELRGKNKKVIYLSPLKALAKEKFDTWTSKEHDFSEFNIIVNTGDYKLTSKKEDLDKANIIIMTNEMFNSSCRNYKSENNSWLDNTGVVIYDEFHNLTTFSRGSHIEVGMMKFCNINKDARIVCLSGTMKNAEELAEWVGYSLNGKETYLIQSEYRPIPLGMHWESYDNSGYYDQQEQEKVRVALEIIEENPDDIFLIFVHTKRTGKLMSDSLLKSGKDAEYHNADVDKEKRVKIENEFRNGKLKYIVSTSSTAQGLNLPARRVIILGVHRGLTEVEDYDLLQMAGRSGRPGFDTRGDAYILVPEGNEQKYIDKLKNPQPITSKLNDYKTLGFHLVSEIHHGEIKTKEDVHKWYERSLAYFQSKKVDEKVVDATMDALEKCGAIKQEEGIYKTQTIGKVSSMFYYSPFDVSDLRRNFEILFKNKLEDNDLLLSMALANVDSVRCGIVNKNEKAEMQSYSKKILALFDRFDPPVDSAIKGGYIYFLLMNGMNSNIFNAQALGYQFDAQRLITVLQTLDSFGCKWNRKGWLEGLGLRLMYGVRSELIPLCSIKEIGKARAEKLWSAGFRTAYDVAYNFEKVQKILNMKEEKIKEIIDDAKLLSIRETL